MKLPPRQESTFDYIRPPITDQTLSRYLLGVEMDMQQPERLIADGFGRTTGFYSISYWNFVLKHVGSWGYTYGGWHSYRLR